MLREIHLKLYGLKNARFFGTTKLKRVPIWKEPFEWFGNPSQITQNIILCPGQGSQYVGMFHRLHLEKRLNEQMINIMKTANLVLGYDIVRLCIEGPKTELDKTVHCQPAVTLASLIGAELLRKNKPWIYDTKLIVAGYSVGEIAALQVAGSITTEDAFTIVKARAEAMQRACDLSASGLYFVHGIQLEDLREKCKEILEKRKAEKPNFDTFIDVVIDSYPKGGVIGATVDCEKDLLALATNKIQVTELPVSGAFHTPLMQPAQEIFKQTLDKIDIKAPKYDLYSNVTGEMYTSPEEIKSLLVRQIAEPVQWQSIVKKLYQRASETRTCELGSGNQLKSMFAKQNKIIIRKYFNYNV